MLSKGRNVNFLSHEIVVTASALTEEHLITLTAQNGKTKHNKLQTHDQFHGFVFVSKTFRLMKMSNKINYS